MQVNIDSTWYALNPCLDLTCHLEGVGSAACHHLDIKRSRSAEVENLVDHVRWLKEKFGVGEFALQFAAQPLHVKPCGRLAILQAHQDLAIEAPNRCAVGIGEIHAHRGQSHIVENTIQLSRWHNLSDHAFDQRK